jgi:hypothetical protein
MRRDLADDNCLEAPSSMPVVDSPPPSRPPLEKHLSRDERRLDRAGHHTERFGRVGRVALTRFHDMSVRLIAFTVVAVFSASAVSAGDLRTQLYASGFVNPVAFVQDPTDRRDNSSSSRADTFASSATAR